MTGVGAAEPAVVVTIGEPVVGLTNAPATFQALMNYVLRPYLRWFVLILFDDILLYSTSWAEHLQHIAIAFNELRAVLLQEVGQHEVLGVEVGRGE
ncbi:hypothetical protein QYE76_067229 [Lolium multiflorum]|uniref:Reverse transcriptase domain-containing protein n=1 Tax=Lolium multiflorum TaxID=4521 RepID=A0AAD8SCF4_LOLMU|nr:hypothetical protein QYE76_067229 [Lolium multiflorum]